MNRRDGLTIKKKILNELKKSKELSLGELERRINTNNKTIWSHVLELEFFDKVEIIEHEKSFKTGRPYTTVKLA